MEQDNYKIEKCNKVYKTAHSYNHRQHANNVKNKSVVRFGIFIIFLLQFTELVESAVDTQGGQFLSSLP